MVEIISGLRFQVRAWYGDFGFCGDSGTTVATRLLLKTKKSSYARRIWGRRSGLQPRDEGWVHGPETHFFP